MSFAHTATATSTATPDLHHERFGKISSSPSLSAANLTFGNNLQRIDKNPLGINTKSLSSSTTGQDVFDSFITSNLCKPPSVSQDLSQSQPLVQRRIPSATCLRYRKRKKWWITASQPNQQEHQEEESAHTTSSDWFFDLFPENYHPYSRDEIPYWLSYRPEVIDHHILMMYASSTLRRSSPFEIFSDVPSPSSITDDQKTLLNSSTSSSSTQIVLDLGCGPSATWCIGLLRENTKVRVIGLDICPISFDPSHLESSVSSRFRKVHHNFLSGPLPFSDNTFDYVHASFISSGVPETHWTTFMEEVMRVLKPGRAMEILEHNLLVPERRSSFIHSTSPAPSTLNSPKSTNKLKLDNNSSLSNIEHINSTKSGVSGGSIPEPNYQSVKQMIHEILDKQFISPFPLSLIPAQVSMISTGMKRPLMNKLIKLPRITNGFADPSSHRSREGSHSSEPESVEPDEHSLGIVLLQSLVNSICANKEIIWEESWLPMICNRPGFSHLREEGHHQPQHTSTARSIVESSARSLLDRKPTQIFSSQNHHSASSSIGGRLSNNQSNTISTMQSSPSSALERKSLHLRATSSSHGNENENPKKSDLTRSRRLFPASGSTMATTSTTALMRKSSSSASPIRRLSSAQRSEIQSQRKKFDLIWSKWQESLGNVVNSTGHGHGGGDHQSFSNLGLSHALEMSFGWKCEVDLEFHQLLDRQFQYYQQQLKSTELQIEQVRKKSFQERQQQSQEDGVDDGNDSEKEAEGDTKGSTRRRRRRSFSDDQKMLKKMDKKKKKINESTRAEDQYTHDFLTTRRAELKKLMQSIQNDLMMVKKRLGILGSDPSSELNLKTTTKFGDDPDHPRFLGGSSHHPSTGAVPNITGTSSQEEHQGYGKLNIELFVAWKSFG